MRQAWRKKQVALGLILGVSVLALAGGALAGRLRRRYAAGQRLFHRPAGRLAEPDRERGVGDQRRWKSCRLRLDRLQPRRRRYERRGRCLRPRCRLEHDHPREPFDLGPSRETGTVYAPAISPDGRYVAFVSEASSLVPGDTNDVADVFVHDMQTGTTERVSVDSAGGQANDVSGWDNTVALSADGRFVAFNSSASNLVAGDTNNVIDTFVHDRQTGDDRSASASRPAAMRRMPSASARSR